MTQNLQIQLLSFIVFVQVTSSKEKEVVIHKGTKHENLNPMYTKVSWFKRKA